MSKFITQLGQSMPALAQPTQMECWIASYQMLLHAWGLTWDLNRVEKKLEAGGYAKAKECRIRGLSDSELIETGVALRMGCTTTSAISSLAALRTMLQLCGPLWVAGIFEMEPKPGEKKKYKHVVTVIGVDEKYQSICWINPWKWNYWDEPTKAWIGWKWFYSAISNTFNIQGSLQFITPPTAAALMLM